MELYLCELSVQVTEKQRIEFFQSFVGFSVSLTAKPPILFIGNFGHIKKKAQAS